MNALFLIAGKLFLYLLFMFLTFSYFTFYGMMAVGLTANQHLAAVISSAFYSLWNLQSGFLIPRPVSFIYTLSANKGNSASNFKSINLIKPFPFSRLQASMNGEYNNTDSSILIGVVQ